MRLAMLIMSLVSVALLFMLTQAFPSVEENTPCDVAASMCFCQRWS